MNVKIHFLLNPQVITMMSNTYSWALKSKEEFDELPDKEKSEIRDVRGKFNYIDQAVELINLELEDQYRYVGLKRIDETDLKRAYRIQLGQEPDDRLGTIYNWVMAKFPLLLPYEGNKCVKHLCDCNTKHEVQLKLYDDFIEDMEDLRAPRAATMAELNTTLASFTLLPLRPSTLPFIGGFLLVISIPRTGI